mmetsp:Transcript_12864/g.36258  ORF Transcript_12864/g.36258 Transcript_12864/m.36258 type:complete len:251 (+) Transcript_12864:351-1103(+)|eukprot:CAMPEP_0172370644 /NCGR_PEP_ID=MMETSP1060-20121228/38748_1 /TAXON_ID=37318 /ORGANISM="Pseudo-nitzschia pungens, Strain cf. cingulata" /LENGTH=250 /DNA_ID=CAMNT_0013095975 /DNA_START=334 /DNA_END=1086 /DNA_ORIENTATION=-
MSDVESNGDSELVTHNDKEGQSLDKSQVKSRTSMDYEFHDDLETVMNNMKKVTKDFSLMKTETIDENCDSEINSDGACSKDEPGKRIESTKVFDYMSDEDSFACAESDCEPNQFYLDEMLEDIHPERLNLFDYKRAVSSGSNSSRIKKENGNGSDSYLDHSLHNSSTRRFDLEDAEDDENLTRKDMLSAGDDSDSGTEVLDEEDTFDSGPTAIGKGSGRRGGANNFGSPANAGPGRPLLRQPSQKAVWGK